MVEPDKYYPYDRLAIRLEPSNMIIEGLFWLTSYWGVYQRVNSTWEEYFPEVEELESVVNSKYIHIHLNDFDEITKRYDHWKAIEPNLDEPLDFDYCQEFQYQYSFEDIVPIADGYPPLREFYEIYRFSRNFIDGYHDGLENPLICGVIGAGDRPLFREDMHELRSLRLAYEAEISRRLNMDLEAKINLKLSRFASHPIIFQQVKSLEIQAYNQYQLECFRIRNDDDWGIFYPTTKFLDFMKNIVEISYVELNEISNYFQEFVLRSAHAKSGYEPHPDPREVSDWYKAVME